MSIFDRDKDGRQITHGLPNPGDLDNDYRIRRYLHRLLVGTFEVDTGLQ